jgi:hypothetical protein
MTSFKSSLIRKLQKSRWINWLQILLPVAPWRLLAGIPRLWVDYRCIRRQRKQRGRGIPVRFSHPCVGESKELLSGTAHGHYFHQDLLVARRIHDRNPQRHVDVGSRVDGFVAHVAAFRPLEVFDIRPQSSTVPNVVFRQADLMSDTGLAECCDSLSCLHTLEHFGLGRYGDSVDIDGYLKGFRQLASMVRPGGMFYLSVPIGPERIEFNAHRVFAIRTILDLAKPQFDLVGFSYVDDAGNLHENVELSDEDISRNLNCYYSCGIFELKKMRRV